MGSGQNKKIKRSVIERVDNLELGTQNLVEQINKSLTTVDGQLTMQQELIGAIVAIVGVEQVKEAIEAARAAKKEQQLNEMLAQAAAAKAALEAGVASGEIAAVPTVGERSVIVGVERTKEGVEIPPGRSQLLFAMVKAEFKGQILGKGPGTVIATDSGGTFTIDEVYDFTGKTTEALPAEGTSDEPTAADQAVEDAVIGELVADAQSN